MPNYNNNANLGNQQLVHNGSFSWFMSLVSAFLLTSIDLLWWSCLARSQTHDNCWWIGGEKIQGGYFVWNKGPGNGRMFFGFTDWDVRNGQPDNNWSSEAYVQICKYTTRSGMPYIAWNDNASDHKATRCPFLDILVYECVLWYLLNKNKILELYSFYHLFACKDTLKGTGK